MKKLPVVLLSFVVICSCSSNDAGKGDADATATQQQRLNALKDAVKAYPDSAPLRGTLVETLDSLKQYKDAIAEADSMLYRDRGNSGLWIKRGQLLESNGDTAEAIRSYTNAVKIYPSPEAQLDLANLLAEHRDHAALFICARIDSTGLGRETDANCNFIRGVYYARTGNSKQAMQYFDKAIADNYTLMEAYMEKGFIFYEEKQYQQALQVFDKAATIDNRYSDAWYWKAKCLEALNNKKEALEDYKTSLALDKQQQAAAAAIKRLE